MNRIVIMLAAALTFIAFEGWNAPTAHAAHADTTWLVTAADVGLAPGGGTGTAPVADKPAAKFVIVATVKVGETAVWQGTYTGNAGYASEAECRAFIADPKDDARFAAGNIQLEMVAKASFGEDAKVSVSCEAEGN